ncbi:Fc.00g115940.m01.CDS01 [Cosmosporella sp. VM-42]
MDNIHMPSAPDGPTGRLCSWINSVNLTEVPAEIRTRAKYLILDGLACAIIGSHLPWSETSVRAVLEMEGSGACNVIGYERRIGPLAAALLNSTFIQAFELDDYHSDAPLHSNAIILPALLAAAEHMKVPTSGADFLLATIVGYEVGPRIGLGLHGGHMLSMGWHSGAVFGPSASAASVSKLFNLRANQIEDALGIACTQACGLMSAQYGSDVKRMQHGFASRNGLFAALMAKGNYVGIKQVYEEPYGGFLATFGQGSGKDPLYRPDEIFKGLDDPHIWQIDGIRLKAYASMAGTHCTIDCIKYIQQLHPEQMNDISNISSLIIEICSEAVYKHGGWKAKRPMTATGAQMSNEYAAALQLVDKQVMPAQFQQEALDRDILWELIGKMQCVYNDALGNWWAQRVTVSFRDGRSSISHLMQAPLGIDPILSNDDILKKWRMITEGIIEAKRREMIENYVLNLEGAKNIIELIEILSGIISNPFS